MGSTGADSVVDLGGEAVAGRLPAPRPPLATAPLVMIDPGHGGKDPGAIGTNGDGLRVREADVVWAVSVATVALLNAAGVQVALTRKASESILLRARTAEANRLGAAAFVSIHCNSHETAGANGYEVLQYRSTSSGAQLASKVEFSLAQSFEAANLTSSIRRRGVKERPDLWVLRRTDMPACMVELPFISNRPDRELLTSGLFGALTARSITDGVLSYMAGIDG